MSTTLFVDAFGRFDPIPERVAPDPESPQEAHEYLWSIFRDRSGHMRWSADSVDGSAGLWNVEEAELTHHLEGSRIGFAQVSLDVNPATPDLANMNVLDAPPPDVDMSSGEWAPVPMLADASPPTDPVVAISPLIQCLDDSLRWFGTTEISAYQVTGYDLQPGQATDILSSVLGWFSVVIPGAIVPAIITMASTQRGNRLVSEVFGRIEPAGAYFFEVGPLVEASRSYAAGLDWGWLQLQQLGTGIAVSMPEWSTAAVGWLIAAVFDAALPLESAPEALSVRVTRLVD